MDNKFNTKPCRIFALLFLGMSMLGFSYNGVSQEQQDWWFNVEFIAFKRNILASNNEDFSQADFQFTNSASQDIWAVELYLQTLNHTIDLASCNNSLLSYFYQPKLDLALQKTPVSYFDKLYNTLIIEPSSLSCLSEYDKQYRLPFAYYEEEFKFPLPLGLFHEKDFVPRDVFAKEAVFRSNTHLLTKEETTSSEVASRIFRQRDIQGLFYTAWRQNVVFGEENAPFFHIKAGNLLKIEPIISYEDWEESYFAEQGQIVKQDEQFFENLKLELEKNKAIDWSSLTEQNQEIITQTYQQKWEMEGLFKVYLDYVNQIPYLHIASEFKHYRIVIDETEQAQFETFPMKQRRRIISKQIHYFDHPAFGFVIRLERFAPPADEIKD